MNGLRHAKAMTPGRMAWLVTLRDNPGARRPRGRVGYDAVQAGLTQWHWVDRSTRARVAPPPMPYPAGWHDQHEADGEELTDAGRRALELEPALSDPRERARDEW